MKKAKFYEKRKAGKVRCKLCPRLCLVAPGDSGNCLMRKNIDGTLYALGYGHVSSSHLDPIEKKPLYRFYPGSTIFSIGGLGCNLECPWCQNWSISQPGGRFPEAEAEDIAESLTTHIAPERIVEAAAKYKPANCIGVAYTYNEPFISFEYVMDTAALVKEAGMHNVLVTNGYVLAEPLQELLPIIDAMNIDIKGFDKGFYRKIGGNLGPILKAAELAKQYCHIEITNLVIPGLNDSREDFEKLVDWIADSLGKDTPLHFSRYFPSHRSMIRSTPLETLSLAVKIAKEKLDHVYLGNV